MCCSLNHDTTVISHCRPLGTSPSVSPPACSAKVFAAEHGTTINALVRELLLETLTREGRARAAANRLLALADRGPYFTTDPASIRREELHERR
jgi:hypothetical protein